MVKTIEKENEYVLNDILKQAYYANVSGMGLLMGTLCLIKKMVEDEDNPISGEDVISAFAEFRVREDARRMSIEPHVVSNEKAIAVSRVISDALIYHGVDMLNAVSILISLLGLIYETALDDEREKIKRIIYDFLQ